MGVADYIFGIFVTGSAGANVGTLSTGVAKKAACRENQSNHRLSFPVCASGMAHLYFHSGTVFGGKLEISKILECDL